MTEAYLAWDPAQVAQYFSAELSVDLRTSFLHHEIDGSLLPFLTTGHLRELGIESLALRLRLKRKINDLLTSSFAGGDPKTLEDSDLRLNSIDINSNYISMEALSACVHLLRDMSRSSSRVADESTDIKKLSDSVKKLRTDLNPVIRLIKESKPLPTPTLDPGAYVSSPTQTVNSLISTLSWDSENGQTPTSATTLILPGSSPNKSAFSPRKSSLIPSNASSPSVSSPGVVQQTSGGSSSKTDSGLSPSVKTTPTSPTQSHRFSSGSVLSVGVGKVTDVKSGISSRFPSKPRLVDAKTPSGSMEDLHEMSSYKTISRQASISGNRPVALKSKSSSSSMGSNAGVGQSTQANQPLKQLKASSEDTCLKVLQHAMKRHHIPREKWSKYVLVVCYADKERILKLTEKPVVIFKELQEHGQNPTIMLRERASTSENEYDYEDSRIGDDIPGGTL